MPIYNQTLLTYLSEQNAAFLGQFNRGLEREALRITPEGKLSQINHPEPLGSALTNEHITTDYSESLLEFITPVENQIDKSIAQLSDVQTYTYQHINGEYLWPMSMPCFVGCEEDIRIAQYGHSNIGKMKTLYREGLRHRYGSMMQVISGVHFNFSFPESFWQAWAKTQGVDFNQDAISSGYLSLIRNLKRHLWLLPYLFGASPALCSSFVAGKEHMLPFEKVGKGTLYLPYATSLRLSDLGYTNNAQADLNICYNDLAEYIAGLRRAINLPSEEFSHIGIKDGDSYKQLNVNVLQIENEFYSAIRPKRVTLSGEKPTDALEQRGIQYIEVRALDVDPFSFAGVSESQLRFMDLLLIWCALGDTKPLYESEQAECDENLSDVIKRGREPNLTLKRSGSAVTLQAWADEILAEIGQVADVLDSLSGNKAYSNALSIQQSKVNDPDLAPSGQIIKRLVSDNLDNGTLGMQLAKTYKLQADGRDYSVYNPDYLQQHAAHSIDKQREIEQADTQDFDSFLADYFNT